MFFLLRTVDHSSGEGIHIMRRRKVNFIEYRQTMQSRSLVGYCCRIHSARKVACLPFLLSISRAPEKPHSPRLHSFLGPPMTTSGHRDGGYLSWSAWCSSFCWIVGDQLGLRCKWQTHLCDFPLRLTSSDQVFVLQGFVLELVPTFLCFFDRDHSFIHRDMRFRL